MLMKSPQENRTLSTLPAKWIDVANGEPIGASPLDLLPCVNPPVHLEYGAHTAGLVVLAIPQY